MTTLESMIKVVGGEQWWGTSPFEDRLMIVAPAHRLNYYSGAARHELRVCTPIAYFHHEPQEPVDDRESTVSWFQNPDADASTTYYGDSDGDEYQCAPLNRAPIANGWTGDRPIPRFNDGGPEFAPYSLNQQSHSKEYEGYTHNIQQTFTNQQYAAAVDNCALFLIMYNLPRNPMRVGLAHADVASDRSDGIWIARKSGIPQEAVNRVLQIEKDIQDLKAALFGVAASNNKRNDGQDGLLWAQQVQINELKK